MLDKLGDFLAEDPYGNMEKVDKFCTYLEMLPTYHNHEKTFDKGTNRHGRTHAAPANEIAAARNLRDGLNAELDAKEREQTENLSDRDVVDLVEDVIRSSPKDFPLLTKYYLNAE